LRHLGPLLGYGLIALIVSAIICDLTSYEVPTITGWAIVGFALAGFVYTVIKNNMFPYVLKRLLDTVFVLWVIASLIFILLKIMPGGPFDREKRLPPEIEANINAKYGLNDPLPVQYINYLKNVSRGNLGESYKYLGRSVNDIIAESMPVSFQLGFYALLLGFIIGIPAGVWAASKHNTFTDNGLMFFAISGVALPSFVVAPILILIFSTDGLDWLPAGLWETPICYILPVWTLGTRPAAVIARLTRASVLEVIRTDFVRTAVAKGLNRQIILFKHVLRNSLIPVLTVSGPLLAGILSGSFIIEKIFSIPGMGPHLISSVNNRDYPLILGLTLLYAVILIFANLIVDLLYVIVDPRMKVGA